MRVIAISARGGRRAGEKAGGASRWADDAYRKEWRREWYLRNKARMAEYSRRRKRRRWDEARELFRLLPAGGAAGAESVCGRKQRAAFKADCQESFAERVVLCVPVFQSRRFFLFPTLISPARPEPPFGRFPRGR